MSRKYPFNSIWQDLENMSNYIQHATSYLPVLSSQTIPNSGCIAPYTPYYGAIRGEIRVDVREHEHEVIVVADIPGMKKDEISISLENPRALSISCERKEEKEVEEKGYYLRERTYGSIRRNITLPCDVTEDDAQASFKNGVLEVHLKKMVLPVKSKIEIE
jgi:HSP20 family protein